MYFFFKTMFQYPKRLAYIQLLFACIAIVFSYGCKPASGKDDHPEYFSAVFKSYDSLPNEMRPAGIAMLDSALKNFAVAGDGDKLEIYSRKTFFYLEVSKDYEKAFAVADSMLLIAQPRIAEQRFAVFYANALFKKGDTYSAAKNYSKAIEYFLLGKQVVVTRIKDKCALAGYSGRIANIIFRQGRYLTAARYYLEGYNEEATCQKDRYLKFVYMQGNLNNVGTCYYNAGVYDSASYYFKRALDFINKTAGDFPDKKVFTITAKAVVYGSFARVADKQGRFAEAEQLYLKSINDVMKEDVDYGRATQLDLAAMYIRQDSLNKAEKLLKEINPNFTHSLVGSGILRWSRLMANLYDKKQEPVISHRYLQKYLFVKDSIDEREKVLPGLDVGRELENREQKAMNELLKKENELKSLYLLVSIIASIMAVVIVLLIWFNLRRSASHVKQLEDLNVQVQQKNENLQQLNDEILQKNEDLQKAFVSLEQSHKENTRITRIVAHDLKNPISGIYNLVYAMLRKEQPESLKEVLELIQDACANSMRLIKDLLSEKKKLAVAKQENVDMLRLLEYCIELLQPKASEKNQQLLLHAEPVSLLVNRQKMWRVASNILTNAIKFSPADSVIEVTLEKKEASILVSVKDNGIGIPAELQDKIFSLSPDALRSGTAGEESYGLGLAISRKIVEEHHGRLWFESQDGKGTVFYVELPLNGQW
ncbi:tetratricopeptide repeat-containing sensor histidine kinase [Foetidibacter luteolus]|uniref:tetratricopeptide repeat-containing sensor histidine kinase n=1 Tax=Foetidibacter luteolus TaxID=2608880 RepID=UPI00129A2BBB|nr:tetratricopeptide repeat-containing sensor histidine kinase [Foetidibacter luteolus]